MSPTCDGRDDSGTDADAERADDPPEPDGPDAADPDAPADVDEDGAGSCESPACTA